MATWEQGVFALTALGTLGAGVTGYVRWETSQGPDAVVAQYESDSRVGIASADSVVIDQVADAGNDQTLNIGLIVGGASGLPWRVLVSP